MGSPAWVQGRFISGSPVLSRPGGAAPGAGIHFVYGLKAGTFKVPGCPGLTVDIEMPVIAGISAADPLGQASFSGFVPSKLSGRTVLIQAVEHSACTASNLVTHTFP